MELSALTLQHFRSYKKGVFQFSPKITLIIGPNTAGKTNILEGIFCLATGKSFRAEKESDMVRWGEQIARVQATINPTNQTNLTNPTNRKNTSENNEEIYLELVVTTGEVNGEKAPTKKYLVNGVPRRQIDFVGNIRAVLFAPGDLELITDSPSLRRQYLNSVLVQTDREYRRNLYSYERGLRQRNKLLDLINEGKAQRSQLLFWNQLLIASGSYITEKREALIEFINKSQVLSCHSGPPARRCYASSVAGGRAGILKISHPDYAKASPGTQVRDDTSLSYQIIYDKSVISESRLLQYKNEEIAAKSTLVGPQRDDFSITKLTTSPPAAMQQLRAGNSPLATTPRDVSRFGSRGEQRLAVLWLKVAELNYIESETESRPILLLDDIFSELDEESREIVLSIIYKQQTIITSAEEEVEELFGNNKNTYVIRLPIDTI